MNQFNEITIKVNKSTVLDDYYTVDMTVIVDGRDVSYNVLVGHNDFVSKFEQILDTIKKEIPILINTFDMEE
jgi:hypothetical protein